MAHTTERADPPTPPPANETARFRVTLVRVMAVQVVALALLWLLQSRYSA